MEVRLQKLIAGTGLASRRKAEELITSGRVTINGHVVKELGTKVDPDRDHVKVDGKHLRAAQPYVYLILNKPKNVMSTLDDPEGRPTVKDFLRGVTAGWISTAKASCCSRIMEIWRRRCFIRATMCRRPI